MKIDPSTVSTSLDYGATDQRPVNIYNLAERRSKEGGPLMLLNNRFATNRRLSSRRARGQGGKRDPEIDRDRDEEQTSEETFQNENSPGNEND